MKLRLTYLQGYYIQFFILGHNEKRSLRINIFHLKVPRLFSCIYILIDRLWY